jgi:hypothetical protein
MSSVTTGPLHGTMLRSYPAAKCDSGAQYVKPDPTGFPRTFYYGYMIAGPNRQNHTIIGKAPWGDEFGDTYSGDPTQAPSHPVLWHRGMMNACANRPLTDRPESYGYDMNEPSLYGLPNYGQSGTMYRTPRAIVYTTMVNYFSEDLAMTRFFLANGQLFAQNGIFNCRAPQFGGRDQDVVANNWNYWYNGWLDAFLPRSDPVLLPLEQSVGPQLVACCSTDTSKYVGGEVYEIVRCECDAGNQEYWRHIIVNNPDGTQSTVPLPELAVSGYKAGQQLLKANRCSKYRCTVITYNDTTNPAQGLTNPDYPAWQAQVQVNNDILGQLDNRWQQVAPAQPLSFATITATINGLLPDIKQFFGIT